MKRPGRRRRRYADVQGVGPSELVPFRTGEDHTARHSRRLNYNLRHEEELRQFAETRNITFTVTNEGHHWVFRRDKHKLEWWPSTGKMVRDHNWTQGLHVHDHQQILIQLRNFFPEQKLPKKPRKLLGILGKFLHLAKDEV